MVGKYTINNLLKVCLLLIWFMFLSYVYSERRADNIATGTRAYVTTTIDTQHVLSWIERQTIMNRRMY